MPRKGGDDSSAAGKASPKTLADTELDPEAHDEPSTAPLGHVYLVCHHEEGVKVVALAEGTSTIIGRAPDAGVRIDSPRVSRHHARVTLGDQQLFVEDLGSRNGTRINREVLRSARAPAKGGDVLKVGPLQIVVAQADRALERDERPDVSRTMPPGALVGDPDEDDDLRSRGIVVADPSMVKLFQVVRRLATTSSTVLILGETGAGKEVIAEQLHRLSRRADGPFVRLNCASLPDTLLESELFGHEKGAFTSADKRRIGYFEAAHKGTLLLDEIGEMPVLLQSKLLRVLEDGRVARLGSTDERDVDVRILCATNRDLEADVRDGRLRQDLFYRINTFTLHVPPLRDRPTEIELLADRMARRFANEAGLPAPVISPKAAAHLLTHGWPGNVRELRNVMEHAVVMADGASIEVKHLPRSISGGLAAERPAIRTQLADVERASIEAALATAKGNRTHAAKRLGMSRRALIYKMIKYGLRE